MRTRLALISAAVLLLSGCWEANTPLMPESVKDSLFLEGTYDQLPKGRAGTLTIRRLSNNEFQAEQTDGFAPQTEARISLDEVEASEIARYASGLSSAGRLYIVQSISGSSVQEIYYTLLVVQTNESGRPLQLIHLEPSCSTAARDIVGPDPDDPKKCLFRSYTQVKLAVQDAIQWLNDSRIPPASKVYLRRD